MIRRLWRLVPGYSRDLAAFALSSILAFELRFDGALPAAYRHGFWIALGIWPSVKILAFALGGVNRGQWRYTSIYEAQRIALLNSAGSVLGAFALVLLLGPWGIPRSIYILEWIISCFLILGSRLIIRAAVIARSTRWAQGEGTRTLIYGAGSAGLQLLWELRQNRALSCDVIGLLDDNPTKVGLILDGKRVLGTGDSLNSIARKYAIKRVLIAIPSATGPQMVRILKLASDAGVEYKMVPSLGDLIQDKRLGIQIRNIAVEDLLGRQSVQLDLANIRGRIQGKVVMVTGAAGSIGSELCRQIARFDPAALIGFDQAETPLFQIDREMRHHFPGTTFHPEIGNVTEPEHLNRVMKRYGPSIVYHAAAYKHVPLMERHVFAVVQNNVFGTWETALAAIRHGVDDFVLISTDKAVRPSSVMGATKRISELVMRALQTKSDTRFVTVRFGNVLGSNGSVVPIFKEQIANGGPVTVTHPEMRRYFMTIPEAAQLVLQAFSFGKGGDVFLLDMGEPVKIVDLATNLILLSGLKPEKDIRIRFTGLRPGEKLFEELNLHNESLLPTLHTKIRRYASPSSMDSDQIMTHMEELEQIVERRDQARLVKVLRNMIPDYTPSAQLCEAALPVETIGTGILVHGVRDKVIAEHASVGPVDQDVRAGAIYPNLA
ncbi:MAG TPA: nucleoside-diphosphate sugar epimerase/dehydratase [Terracidiphilus sp.]|nr:nucleoside-diphosphate sugar epimerase/dehydratase [Terracidiphilus sp.]